MVKAARVTPEGGWPTYIRHLRRELDGKYSDRNEAIKEIRELKKDEE